ncbi:hypothetical protein DEU56DRAFT_834178 [Suillus clintonianus]|uniref:uncharacterized protein n=1 Tax=Suillus clintonianus TaxID=1904413 RepID=UPI001B86834F|nr:uncharacterized protein DEU56DRAFT_834178 [Suillus clintonianus]KAG2121423.1 hypothetical protein DEU56DRAFT_834178 [Suillus clintonianus]
MLIQVVAYSSQVYVSVLILLRARAMLIQVVAHSSQAVEPYLLKTSPTRSQSIVSTSILCRSPTLLIREIANPH